MAAANPVVGSDGDIACRRELKGLPGRLRRTADFLSATEKPDHAGTSVGWFPVSGAIDVEGQGGIADLAIDDSFSLRLFTDKAKQGPDADKNNQRDRYGIEDRSGRFVFHLAFPAER